MEFILTGVGEFFKLWCTRKSQGQGRGEDGAEPLYHLVLSPYSHHTGESLFPFFRPYCHSLIVSPMSLKLKFSIKDLKFCKECMSIGDLSLYQPGFSQFSVAAISVDCYLSHSSSDLNQRWRLQKILPPPPPPPNTHTHRVNRNVCTTGLRLI